MLRLVIVIWVNSSLQLTAGCLKHASFVGGVVLLLAGDSPHGSKYELLGFGFRV